MARIGRHENEIRRIEAEIAKYDAAARVREVEREIAAFDIEGKVAAVERRIEALEKENEAVDPAGSARRAGRPA